MSEDARAALARARQLLQDRFKVAGLLGSGGMATVVRARHVALGRDVAIKLLPERFEQDAVARARFIREAQACARLTHPNLVTVYDVDEDAGYIVMELVDGQSLKTKLSEGPMPLADAVSLGRSLIAALRVAHGAGIVHRDIKPANILIDEDGTAKLADFGIAMVGEAGLTQTGALVGTPAYMAPEQLRGRDVDGRADIYALGATLFEAATGKKLHAKDASIKDVGTFVRDTTKSRGFARVIARAVAEEPDDRFQTVDEMERALGDVARGVEPSATIDRNEITGRRSPLLAFVLAAAVGLVATVVAALTIRRADDPSTDAPGPLPVRLALLPFEETTGRSDLAFVKNGLPAVLQAELSASPAIEAIRPEVLERELTTTSPDTKDWLAAARSLGADVAVHGDVRPAKRGLAARVELLAIRGEVLSTWTKSVDSRRTLTAFVQTTSESIRQRAVVLGGQGDVVYRRLLGRGVEALGSHTIGVAIRHFERAIEADPKQPDAYYYLAIAKWWAEAPVEELLAATKASRDNGLDEDRRMFLAGLELAVEHRWPEAIDLFARFRTTKPNDRAALYGHFEALFHGGRPREAFGVYREMEKRYPTFKLGALHVLTYSTVRADDELMTWANAHVEGDPLYLEWEGRRLSALGDVDGALEMLARVVDDAEDSSRVRLQTALLQTRLLAGQNEIVRVRLERVGAGYPEAWLALALVEGDPAEIEKRRTAAYETVERRFDDGISYAADGLYRVLVATMPVRDAEAFAKDAARFEERITERDKRNPRRGVARAFVAMHLGDRGALARLSERPHREIAGVAKGGLAMLDGRFTEAAAAFAAAAEASGDGRFLIASRYYEAEAHQRAGDHDAAIRACDDVIHPHLFEWMWAGYVGPCLAITARAHRLSGRSQEAKRSVEMLRERRRAAPSDDALLRAALD